MWIVLGTSAIITAIFNLLWYIRNKDPKWFRFISLALTALTLCAFYSINAQWVVNKDWAALMDVAPTMSETLWKLTFLSIMINGISLFRKNSR